MSDVIYNPTDKPHFGITQSQNVTTSNLRLLQNGHVLIPLALLTGPCAIGGIVVIHAADDPRTSFSTYIVDLIGDDVVLAVDWVPEVHRNEH